MPVPKQDRIHLKIAYIFLAILGFWFYYQFHNGERIALNKGLGSDGNVYAVIAVDLERYLYGHKVDKYFFQRVLPSFIIHYGAKAVGFKFQSQDDMVQAFYVYNCILLVLCALLFYLIANHFKWDLKLRFIGFSSIFMIYPILKHFPYYSPLTDISAMTIGILMFYFYLKKRSWGVLLCGLMAAFVFPTMIYLSAIWFLFPISKKKKYSPEKVTVINHLLPFIPLIGFLGVIYYSYNVGFEIPNHTNQINYPLLIPSIFGLAVYLYFAGIAFTDYRYLIKSFKKQSKLMGLIWIFLLILLVRFTINTYASNIEHPTNFKTFLMSISMQSVVNPLTNVVSHIIFYGPLMVVLIFIWKQFIELIKSQYGIGMFLFIVFNLLLAITPESRRLINVWPVFVVLICQVLYNYKFSWRFTYIIVGLTLFLSRFWFEIGVERLAGESMEFPLQRHFMHSGPWMNNHVYYAFTAIAITIILMVYFLMKKEKVLTAKVAG
ncbi:MAG: hypothetical protein COC01_03680 [Bacteroidetes bacterium]|nr:MAG: hypothetical protein COC01_03680 [Bacteroidota bacterium]